MTTKVCTKCKIEKNVTDFGNDKAKSDGKHPSCKSCKSVSDKRYKQNNQDKVKENDKKYYQKNSEKIKDRAREWYLDNKEHHLAVSKQWRLDNQEKWKEGKRKWNEANKSKMMEYNNKYIKEKYQNDIQYRIKSICSARIRSLVKKETSTFDLLGCEIEFFRKWIEYQFNSDMSWDNIGSHWHFDHVIPCVSFDLSISSELRECFNWQNIRPLQSTENLQKHDKIIPDVIQKHKLLTKKFLGEIQDVPSL